jgi:hypothetical protein
MSSRTEQLTRDVRTMPVFRQLVPQEAGVGWPMPFRTASGVYVTLLFFGYGQDRDGGTTALFPPLSMITVDWAGWRPVEYLDLRYRHPWPGSQPTARVGTFPHPPVNELTVAEYRERRAETFCAYDEVLGHLGAGTSFPDDLTARFRMLLRLVMEPGLEPYYRQLSPGFFGHFLPGGEPAGAGPARGGGP